MEGGSINSCINQTDHEDDDIQEEQEQEEESGWTYYIDDDVLFPQNRENINPSSSTTNFSDYEHTPSLISDAASISPWKLFESNNKVDQGLIPQNVSKLLNNKKKAIREEGPLDDTASSPANSPKVSSMKQYHHIMNPKKNDDSDTEYSSSQKKGSLVVDNQYFSQLQTNNETSQMGFIGRENNECSDLKKKGLCLVPMSTYVNYI